MRPFVSVVIPVLNDTRAAGQLLPQLSPHPAVELIVVDGGADAGMGTFLAARPDVRLVRTAPGRGRQMNAGAAIAAGEWLLFLHADSCLPERWREGIATVAPDAIGGWFRFALDDPAWQARVIERLVAWRVHWLRLPYGDQGIFVRRDAFEALGGFADLPLMEDVNFVRRVKAAGPLREVPLPLVTSARRWRRDGWFRRSTRNLALVTLYFAGVSPATLARWYGGDR
jgi:rSAM/selenodomain-associated transferase 2